MPNREIWGKWMEITLAKENTSEFIIVCKQILIGLGAFVSVPLDFFYKPGTAILRPAEAVFFCIGMLFCLIHFRDPRSKLILPWVILFGLLGGPTENAPSAQWYVAAAPVSMLGLAAGFFATERGVLHFLPSWRKGLQIISLLAALLLCFDDSKGFDSFRRIPNIQDINTACKFS